MKKQMIWSSMDMLDDEAREQYQELQREVQEDDTYTVSDAEWADVVSGSLTDERLNLDKKIEGVIIAFASVGTWRGPRQALLPQGIRRIHRDAGR